MSAPEGVQATLHYLGTFSFCLVIASAPPFKLPFIDQGTFSCAECSQGALSFKLPFIDQGTFAFWLEAYRHDVQATLH